MINIPTSAIFPQGLRGVLRVNSAEAPTASAFQNTPTFRNSGASALMYSFLERMVNAAVAAQATFTLIYLPAGAGALMQTASGPNPGAIVGAIIPLTDQGTQVGGSPDGVIIPLMPLMGSSRFRTTEAVPLTGSPWPSLTSLPIATVADVPVTGQGQVVGFHTQIIPSAPYPRLIVALSPNVCGGVIADAAYSTSLFASAAISPAALQIEPFAPNSIGAAGGFNNGSFAQSVTLAQMNALFITSYIAAGPFHYWHLRQIGLNVLPSQLTGPIARMFVGAEGFLQSGLRVAPIDIPTDFIDGFTYFPSTTALVQGALAGPIGARTAIPLFTIPT